MQRSHSLVLPGRRDLAEAVLHSAWYHVRRITGVATMVVTTLLLWSSAAAAQAKATVTVDRLNVRASASIESAIVGSLTRGTSVSVEERAETWTRVTSGKVTGWVRSSMLSFTGATPAAPTPAPASTPPATTPPARQATQPPATPAPTPAAPAATPRPAREDSARTQTAATPAVQQRQPESDAGLRIGILGSATPREATPTVAAANHLAAVPLLMIQGSRLGLFAAPEIGTGAGYRTLMLGGGISLRLLSIGRLHIRAAGGYTTYSETLDAVGTEAPVTVSAHGASAGGIVTLRLLGRASLAYRGHLIKGFGAHETLEFQRHSVGLVF